MYVKIRRRHQRHARKRAHRPAAPPQSSGVLTRQLMHECTLRQGRSSSEHGAVQSAGVREGSGDHHSSYQLLPYRRLATPIPRRHLPAGATRNRPTAAVKHVRAGHCHCPAAFSCSVGATGSVRCGTSLRQAAIAASAASRFAPASLPAASAARRRSWSCSACASTLSAVGAAAASVTRPASFPPFKAASVHNALSGASILADSESRSGGASSPAAALRRPGGEARSSSPAADLRRPHGKARSSADSTVEQRARASSISNRSEARVRVNPSSLSTTALFMV